MALTVNTTLISGTRIITDDVSGSVAVDYTTQLSALTSALTSISTALNDINTAANVGNTTLNTISNNIAALAAASASPETIEEIKRIADALEELKAVQAEVEQHQKAIKTLAEGSGIHTLGPFDLFQMVSVYKLLVEQGKASDVTDAVASEEQTAALANTIEYINKINSDIPKAF